MYQNRTDLVLTVSTVICNKNPDHAVNGMLSTGMLAWRLNAGFGTSECRLLQLNENPRSSCMIERAPTRGRTRGGDGSGRMHRKAVGTHESNRQPRARMDSRA